MLTRLLPASRNDPNPFGPIESLFRLVSLPSLRINGRPLGAEGVEWPSLCFRLPGVAGGSLLDEVAVEVEPADLLPLFRVSPIDCILNVNKRQLDLRTLQSPSDAPQRIDPGSKSS